MAYKWSLIELEYDSRRKRACTLRRIKALVFASSLVSARYHPICQGPLFRNHEAHLLGHVFNFKGHWSNDVVLPGKTVTEFYRYENENKVRHIVVLL